MGKHTLTNTVKFYTYEGERVIIERHLDDVVFLVRGETYAHGQSMSKELWTRLVDDCAGMDSNELTLALTQWFKPGPGNIWK